LGTTRPGCAKPRPPPFRALSARPLPIRNRYEKSALAGTLMLLAGNVVFGTIAFAERTMVITAAAINVGFEAL